MADVKQLGQPPEAELVLVEDVGAWVRLKLDTGTSITLSKDELLSALQGERAA